jgi:hypothetical protein
MLPRRLLHRCLSSVALFCGSRVGHPPTTAAPSACASAGGAWRAEQAAHQSGTTTAMGTPPARDDARWFIGCEGLRCHTRSAARTRAVSHGQVPFVRWARRRPRAARRKANQTVGVSGRADVHQADAPWPTVADAAMSEPASAELERVRGGPRTVLMFHVVKSQSVLSYQSSFIQAVKDARFIVHLVLKSSPPRGNYKQAMKDFPHEHLCY